jgi:HK97 gp10 family phage protein
MMVRIDGLRELDRALGELPKAVARNTLRRVGLKALDPVADSARDMAPDDPETGGNDLRSSIGVGTKLSSRQAKMNRKREDKSFAEVYAGAGPVPHAHLMEFGTVNHGPQPFMRPAWDQHKTGVLETVKTELGGEIAKAAKRVAARAAKKAAG